MNRNGQRAKPRCGMFLFAIFTMLLLSATSYAATETPASFGVDLPTFTHLGFGHQNETMRVFSQVNPIQRLAGIQTTFGFSGIWSYESSRNGMTLFGVTGSRSSGQGRVLFDGVPFGGDRKRKFKSDIGRGTIEIVHKIWLGHEKYKGGGSQYRLSVLSLIGAAGIVSTHVEFPEEDTTVAGKGPEYSVGLGYEKDYLPGQVMHVSGLFVYRDMEFDKLFDRSGMNNDPLELQLRAGVELYMKSGLNISLDVLGAITEATNFNRYGMELGLRYNY